ncbi:protein-export chaperone SecB [Buchnera aphidicola (Muscaphis stroyani)]|uniref:Protein-export protein SecB n=1 Tax=Buchnera aphidicola (Muscaphis stroyani) TaxID=1241869 RepID=A0A4D6YIC7_9GAMM|nr:protein-export chaperone SecB [Buchnera aphidicola]QCI24165.1 protein-export chaperone SecB [Buchnera aphidicola (Muscaphis stroyani)]
MLHKNTLKQHLFEIKRVYIKDVSFECPNAPSIFDQKWKPTVQLNLNTFSNKIELNIFEITLQVRVKVKSEKNLVFLCDVHQAGIFFISQLNEIELNQCIGSYCPNILFPYARECISNLVSHASFPQLNLAPINFDDIYQKHVEYKKMNA